MMKRFIFLLILIIAGGVLFAQLNDKSSMFVQFDEAIGRMTATDFVGDGTMYQYGIGGTGLSYQKWLNPMGYAITAGGVFEPDSGDYAYSVGAEVMYQLYAADFGKNFSSALYAFTGIGNKGYWDSSYDSDTSEYSPTDYAGSMTTGIGVGVELLFFRHFSLPVQFGYSAQLGFGAEEPFNVILFVEGGFRYRY